MAGHTLSPLPLEPWRPTRDTLQGYLRLLGAIRAALAPREKHRWHTALHATAVGLTTTPIPGAAAVFELQLDLLHHVLLATASSGVQWQIPLCGQSLHELGADLLAYLRRLGVAPVPADQAFNDNTPGSYDPVAATRFWQSLSWIDAVFKRFKAQLPGESGPVHVFPHHINLALLWLSGRKLPTDSAQGDNYADEQMSFGFVTGDAAIPEPYFYVTVNPWPPDLTEAELPPGAYWYSEAFNGAVLPYQSLLDSREPGERLLFFLEGAQQSGAESLRDGAAQTP